MYLHNCGAGRTLKMYEHTGRPCHPEDKSCIDPPPLGGNGVREDERKKRSRQGVVRVTLTGVADVTVGSINSFWLSVISGSERRCAWCAQRQRLFRTTDFWGPRTLHCAKGILRV